MNFDVPLDKMHNEELCIITTDKGDLRYQGAIEQLEIRGITSEKREQILTYILEQERKALEERIITLEANENIGYSLPSKAALFFLGPLSLLSHFGHFVGFIYKPWDINYLRENNFKRKIQQRKELLIAGFILWALDLYLSLKFGI